MRRKQKQIVFPLDIERQTLSLLMKEHSTYCSIPCSECKKKEEKKRRRENRIIVTYFSLNKYIKKIFTNLGEPLENPIVTLINISNLFSLSFL